MRRGRPPAWTDEEREQVLALADEGLTQRAIAEQVFGDTRYRGRVERILRQLPARETAAGHELEAVVHPRKPAPRPHTPACDGEEPTVGQLVRELVNRHWKRAEAEEGFLLPLSELAALLRLERQLEAREELERLRALTRETRG